MYISVPALTTFGVPASAIPDFAVTCMFGDFPIAARYDSGNSRIVINNADPIRNTTSNAFRFNNSAIPVPLNVYITGSCPIQYN
jgi:hypothetical protein